MRYLLLITVCVLAQAASCQEENKAPWAVTEVHREVPKVTPSVDHSAPSDAIVLFDGSSTDEWQKAPNKDVQGSESIAWNIEGEDLVVNPRTGSIVTKKSFGDVQLHIEWNAPVADGKSGQGYSNSGVFFMGKYEVQVLNSYDSETYANGQASSVYKQHIPMVNASRPPGTWQSYDIVFMAPRFSEKGTLVSPARVTVFHNGILTQNNVELLGPTQFIGVPSYEAHEQKLPLSLQDHGDPVRFRNIWIREL
ncbi:MAG: DUF1080 domain-containing protein [Bacteroidota bacterium]